MKLPTLSPDFFNVYGKEKYILIAIAILLVLIPTGSYALSLRSKSTSSASEVKTEGLPLTQATDSAKLDSLSILKQTLQDNTSARPPDSPKTTSVLPNSTDSAQLILGPTLAGQMSIEGRPAGKMSSSKMFLGIAQGEAAINPRYLLSFLIDLDDSGKFDSISLAGLDQGVAYTAYFKGSAQIATSSAFFVKATPTDLGKLSMLTGDLNEDNIVNSADYDLLKGSLGATPSSGKWNPNFDFNLDGIINTLDLAILSRNMGKTGASGPWYSGIPQASASAATKSASLRNQPSVGGPVGSDPKSEKGYWMWFPSP